MTTIDNNTCTSPNRLKDDDNSTTINIAPTNSKFCKELQLYTNNFTTCSHCNLPPTTNNNQKLLTCSNCASTAYHNSSCQRSHWKVHKRCCKKLSQSLAPLKELIRWQDRLVKNEIILQCQHSDSDSSHDGISSGGTKTKQRISSSSSCCWWHPTNPTNSITIQTLQQSNHIWIEAVDQWNAKEYLKAMEAMQFALEVYHSAWSWCFGSEGSSLELSSAESSYGGGSEHLKDVVIDGDGCNDAKVKEEGRDDFGESSMVLAKRLLFLAYCELDGGQVASARQRLVSLASRRDIQHVFLVVVILSTPFLELISSLFVVMLFCIASIISKSTTQYNRFNVYPLQIQFYTPPLQQPKINQLSNLYSTMPTWNSC